MKLVIAAVFISMLCPAIAMAKTEDRYAFVDSTNFKDVNCKKMESQFDEAICTSGLQQKNIEIIKLNNVLSELLRQQTGAERHESLADDFSQEKKDWIAHRNSFCDYESAPHNYWGAAFTVCVAEENKKRIEFLKSEIKLWEENNRDN